jgi:hypothetical protein
MNAMTYLRRQARLGNEQSDGNALVPSLHAGE